MNDAGSHKISVVNDTGRREYKESHFCLSVLKVCFEQKIKYLTFRILILFHYFAYKTNILVHAVFIENVFSWFFFLYLLQKITLSFIMYYRALSCRGLVCYQEAVDLLKRTGKSVSLKIYRYPKGLKFQQVEVCTLYLLLCALSSE
jgi:hypothetical protein